MESIKAINPKPILGGLLERERAREQNISMQIKQMQITRRGARRARINNSGSKSLKCANE
jgi:hypothetical protein